MTLARAISAVENETEDAAAVLRAVHGRAGGAAVVGFTGAPGVGKSTLLSAYIDEVRRRGKAIGVVAVDPSSPVSGGAILGDRIRMSAHGTDDAVFVRSLAARGHLGGLSRTAARIIDVMDAAGKDVIIVETVGTGQSEVEIAEIAHTKIVVCAPGFGDEIQAAKAGILEIADILVVNKADLPLADRTERQLKEAVGLAHQTGWRVPVLRTTATTAEGLPALADTVDAHFEQLDPDTREHGSRVRVRRLMAAAAAQQASRKVQSLDSTRFDALCDRVLTGELGLDDAAARALEDRDAVPAPEAEDRVRRFAARDPHLAALGAELVEGGAGRAVVRLQVRDHHLNFYGYCHGGVIFSLADAAFGLAGNATGTVSVAVGAHIAFANPVREGDLLVATAAELTRSRKIATYRVDVSRGDGLPVASFSGTAFITGNSSK